MLIGSDYFCVHMDRIGIRRHLSFILREFPETEEVISPKPRTLFRFLKPQTQSPKRF